MSQVHTSTIIDRPIEEVFDYINHPKNDSEWQPQVLERRVEGQLGPGTQVALRRRILGRVVETKARVLEYDPPNTATSRSVAGPLKFEGGFHLNEVEEGTRVVFKAEVEPTGAYQAGAGTFAEEFEKEIEANLSNLKQVLEN